MLDLVDRFKTFIRRGNVIDIAALRFDASINALISFLNIVLAVSVLTVRPKSALQPRGTSQADKGKRRTAATASASFPCAASVAGTSPR